MSDYGIGGPDWFWKFIGFLIIVGLLSVIVLVIYGLTWLFNHVHIY